MNINQVKNPTVPDPEMMAENAMAAVGMTDAGGIENINKIVSEMLLNGNGINGIVKNTVDEKGAQFAAEAPEIDEPEVKESEIDAADLAKLVALLKLETDEKQATEARKRIESQKSEIADRAKTRLEKIDKSLKEMDKAAKTAFFMKVFSWIAVGISIAVAAAASIATCGVALGPAIGAVIALTMQILNETGVMEDLTNAFADWLEDSCHLSKETAKIVASVVIAVAQIALSLIGGYAGGVAAASSSTKAITTMTQAMEKFSSLLSTTVSNLKVYALGVSLGMGLIGLCGQMASADAGYEAGMAGADLSHFEALLAMLKQQLEDSEKELEELIQMLSNGPAQIAKLIESSLESKELIANNIGQMA